MALVWQSRGSAATFRDVSTWVHTSRSDPDTTRYLPDPSQWKMRTRLCDSKSGTGVNAPGHAPQPRHGPATAGNCKVQLVVSDRYGN